MVFDIENIESISDADICFRIKDHLFLDASLMEIRGKTISYATFKKKPELKNIRNLKFRGNYIRSRVEWIKEGEKPSKYFCYLESQNIISKQITKPERKNSQILKNQGDNITFCENLLMNL